MARRLQTFDQFLKIWVWPQGVPQDCTQLLNDQDCIERNAPTYCASCKAYETACRDYESYREEAEGDAA